MFRTGKSTIAIAMTLGMSLAVTQVAEAGGYVNDKCLGKKQGAISKYIKSVAKAWDKYPDDAMSRDAAIAAAATKIGETWTKEETKATDKGADCTASSSPLATLTGLVDTAISTAANAEDRAAVGGYASGAMKARSKYVKDQVKDPGKAKLEEGRAKASTKYLTDASVPASTAALTLESDLYTAMTTAPDYPTTFQAISPTGTIVYGKQELEPQCVDGDPYKFWVRKGSTNNVLMYYQGGGACWNADSCYTVPGSTCKREAHLDPAPDSAGTGFADYDNPGNPFSDWTVVFVSYCTCDVHWGATETTYPGGPNRVGRHFGRINAAVAEKFAREHFVDPDKVFVTGSSAGSYGAIMNSYWLMKDVWPNADFAVLGDAGVGVITQDFLDRFMTNWGVEANFPEDLPGVELPISNLSLVDLIDGLATNYPNARFANYDSSFDGGGGSQCNFFQVMNNPGSDNIVTEWSNWWDQACDWNACMREFKNENAFRTPANYKYFTGAGTRHTMFGSDKVYTEAKSTNAAGFGVTIAEWVQAMADDTPAWENVDCNNMNGDCSLTDSCQGGANAGLDCTSNVDCPGGSCQLDPDTANAPFNNDNTVNCPVTACPCGTAAAKCGGGANEGLFCVDNDDCPDSSCQWVRCPTFEAP